VDASGGQGQQAATIVIQTRVNPGSEEPFAAWQEHISRIVGRAPGYVSHELIRPDPPIQQDWVIVERFLSREAARRWLSSPERAEAMKRGEGLLAGDQAISVIDELGPPPRPTKSTSVILTEVEPGSEQAFREWNARITAAQSTWPGYVGSALQPPVEGVQDQWVTMVTFDSDEQLEAWLGSEDRAALIAESEGIAHDTAMRRVRSGFEGWFDIARPAGVEQPAPWKFNWLILVGLYPIVMLEILFMNNKLAWMNLAFSNLIGNVLSVAFLGWPVLAVLTKLMGWWLQPKPTAARSTGLKGAVVMAIAMAVLVGIFYLIVTYVGFSSEVSEL
jgi:antibiotic biosynthesis monooxygenase (ABM) superfamily enzyme